ncbi:hypothetical protein Pcinc_006533 [Petrolisthes cinctipes]|uniref:Phospholipase A2-like central domain-containing protein n=1 Tax=Petrolisthes cinctipes TaxID=88211 RepID=A0AAE1GCW4_PETCI|nr:hypothetical protein Pcinc_006533 [Petrolisthes cinctipes]
MEATLRNNILLSWLVLLQLLGSIASARMPNFIAQDDLNDGQHEIRIHYNGITARQSSVGPDQDSVSGLVLREIHHERHHRLLTMVYVGQTSSQQEDGLSLRDCKITDDMQEVKEFLDTFETDVDLAMDTPTSDSWSGPLHNVTFVHLASDAQLPKYLRPIVHFRSLRAECKSHLRAARRAVKAKRRADHHHQQHKQQQQQLEQHTVDTHSRQRRWILNEFFILPGTKWCGNEDLARSFQDLDGHVRADSCCRKHDNCPVNIGGMNRKYGIFNPHTTTVSHCICDERSKRSLLSLRMPFTKWCGAHYDAQTYGDLGGLVRLDHCCRQHDLHCPFYIPFMEEKYGLRNYHISTINHCGCDQR